MNEFIIGADEVGLGCFAGPLVVCAVLAPVDWSIPGLNDSKKLSPKKRSTMYDAIQEQAPFIQWHVAWRWPEEIDKLGVGRALVDAFEEAVGALVRKQPDAEIILDGNVKLKFIPHRSMPKADGLIKSVSAASILAKVERDRWMQTDGDSAHPEYGFINHVGYGTPEHIAALDVHGPCPLHRYSYRPVAERVKGVRLMPVVPRERSLEALVRGLVRRNDGDEEAVQVHDDGAVLVDRKLDDEVVEIEVPF